MPSQKTVMIIGGAGYVGSHTTLALNDAGFRTIVFDNFSTGHRDACFGEVLVEGDLAETAKIESVLAGQQVDCVVLCAALIEAGQSAIAPLDFYENNVCGTVSVLKAMVAAGLKKLVFSSTAAVYGNHTEISLLHEKLPCAPITPYGDSKVMVEKMLAACVAAHGFQSISLRYFNASGADAKGRTGERHDPETHLIPLVIQAAQGKRKQINIYGTDYPTPDGTCVRDYVHVTDLASGHVAAVRKLLATNQATFSAVNLGSGRGLSVHEVVDAVKRISEKDFKVVETSRRPGDAASLVADCSLAKEILNWRATHSGIDEIVRDAWAYAQKS